MPSRALLTDNTTPPLTAAARHLSGKRDLSRVLVLIPDLGEAASLRKLLLAAAGAGTGLILPRVDTLRSWLEESVSNQRRILNNHARELMLIEVLRDARTIRGRGNAWQLGDELLKLFDELELSGHNPESLVARMQGDGSEMFLDDADMVSQLWKARTDQMEAEGVTDRVQLYSQALSSAPPTNGAQEVFLCGYDWLQHKELIWLQQHWDTLNITLLVSESSPLRHQLIAIGLANDSASSTSFLDSCFAATPDLLTRAQAWKQAPALAPLHNCQQYVAPSPEHEARFIDAQIRDWLALGKQNIALITEDRQLARRVSAMLKHGQLNIHDDAGWPLSTTMAAGVLERWLECLENDFPQRALLDVLKSPIVQVEGFGQNDVFHFERDIIENEQIARGLDRYRQAIKDRAQRLNYASGDYQHRLQILVDALQNASKSVSHLIREGQYRPAELLNSLETSLSILGIVESYKLDAAGIRLLQEIDDMRQSEHGRNTRFSWQEFRQWLRRAMETHNFRPAREAAPVRIISLQQSLTGQYDAVIVAGLDDTRLPRPAGRLVFFNDQVKSRLGLPSWSQSRDRQLFQFRRLLEQVPAVVLSHSSTNDSGPRLPSSWLSRINSFLKACGDRALGQPGLTKFDDLLDLQLRKPDKTTTPLKAVMPAPSVPDDLLPTRWTATGHQQLIDCPYRFFSSYVLALRAPDDIIEQMSHREYGEKAHLCLQAFHSNVPDLPGPFGEPLSEENRHSALELLLELGRQVFEPNNDADVRHLNWFRIWQAMAPKYLDWQKNWQTEWSVLETEWKREVEVSNRIQLVGKLDRVDHGARGLAIIDYKSGAIRSRQADMLSGEDVQLSTYAMLVSQPRLVTYLSLKADTERGTDTAMLRDDALEEIRVSVLERLQNLALSLEKRANMPANGDESACRYCPAEGLCRKEMWDGE